MGILGEIKQTLNQKSVMRNILFCLVVIILIHLLYGAYRSSTARYDGRTVFLSGVGDAGR